MDLLKSMGELFIPHPLLALLPAAVFLSAAVFLKSRFVSTIAALWGLYAVYESLMKARVLCSGECNIRIDLLAIYPVLALVSIAGIAVLTIHSMKAQQHK